MRASSKLTLTLGLRWDYDSPITERFNRSVRGFDYTATNPEAERARANYAQRPIPELPASAFPVLGGLTFAGANGQPRTLWQGDRNNFAPRIGFAYSPTAKTVLRGGYGFAYVPLGADRSSVNQSGYSLRTTLVPTLDNGQTFIASLANPFPTGWPAPPGNSLGLRTDVGRGISYFRPTGINGYMQRFSLQIQQQLPGEFVLGVMYLGNRGTKLDANRQYNGIPNELLSASPVRDQRPSTISALRWPTHSSPFPEPTLRATPSPAISCYGHSLTTLG